MAHHAKLLLRDAAGAAPDPDVDRGRRVARRFRCLRGRLRGRRAPDPRAAAGDRGRRRPAHAGAGRAADRRRAHRPAPALGCAGRRARLCVLRSRGGPGWWAVSWTSCRVEAVDGVEAAAARTRRPRRELSFRHAWGRRASISSTCSRTCATPTPTRSRRRSCPRSWRTLSTRVRASIRVLTDPSDKTVVVVDDGSGMSRRELARYHDLAASTKTRGEGIGFAGVGIKLGLLVAEAVLTESRRGTAHVAIALAPRVAPEGALEVGAAAGVGGRARHRGGPAAPQPAVAAARRGLRRGLPAPPLRAALRPRVRRDPRRALPARAWLSTSTGASSSGASSARGSERAALVVRLPRKRKPRRDRRPRARARAAPRGAAGPRDQHARQGDPARLGLDRPRAVVARPRRRARRGAGTVGGADAQQGRLPAQRPARHHLPRLPQGDPGGRPGAARRLGRGARSRGRGAAAGGAAARAGPRGRARRPRRRVPGCRGARGAAAGRAAAAADGGRRLAAFSPWPGVRGRRSKAATTRARAEGRGCGRRRRRPPTDDAPGERGRSATHATGRAKPTLPEAAAGPRRPTRYGARGGLRGTARVAGARTARRVDGARELGPPRLPAGGGVALRGLPRRAVGRDGARGGRRRAGRDAGLRHELPGPLGSGGGARRRRRQPRPAARG